MIADWSMSVTVIVIESIIAESSSPSFSSVDSKSYSGVSKTSINSIFAVPADTSANASNPDEVRYPAAKVPDSAGTIDPGAAK